MILRIVSVPQDIEKEIEFFSKESREPVYVYKIAERVIELAGIPKGALILDAGCGEGYWGRTFTRSGYKTIGIDLSEKSIHSAKERAEKDQEFFQGNLLEELPFPPEYFDAIICGGILHHFPDEGDLNKVIGNLSKCLKQNYKMILVEPNGSNPVVYLSRLLGSFLARYYSDIATENETMHSVRTYTTILNNHNYDIQTIKSCRHIVDKVSRKRDIIDYLDGIRRFFLMLVWHFLPDPYCGNEIIIIARSKK